MDKAERYDWMAAREAMTPEELAAHLEAEGVRLAKRKALKRANKQQKPIAVVDRGVQPEPHPICPHRFVCRALTSLETMDPAWNVVVIVEPRKRPPRDPNKPRRGGKREREKRARRAEAEKKAKDANA